MTGLAPRRGRRWGAAGLLALVHLGLALLPAGCASVSPRAAPGLDPRRPRVAAVLPFVDRASGGPAFSRLAAAFTVDWNPLLSDERMQKANAATVLREKVAGNLTRTALRPLDLAVGDAALAREGLDPGRLSTQADRGAAAVAVGAALGVDVVVFGEVLEWDRVYYLLQSVALVGLRLEVWDAVEARLLFSTTSSDLETSGVGKLPLASHPLEAGSLASGEAVLGLRNTLFVHLSDEVARWAVLGLVPAQDTVRGGPPRLDFVAHSAQGPLRAGQELSVAARGAPGHAASFRLGPLGRLHPMTETAPGVYAGSLLHASAEEARAVALTVTLRDGALREGVMTVGLAVSAPGR